MTFINVFLNFYYHVPLRRCNKTSYKFKFANKVMLKSFGSDGKIKFDLHIYKMSELVA